MCGITLYISKHYHINDTNAIHKVLDSLYQLQNRGYDSFGIGFLDKNKGEYEILKYSNNYVSCSKNDLYELFKQQCKEMKKRSRICIGHSRWATHGIISDNNAHPHHSYHKNFFCVHNGIIENYQKIKSKLIGLGFEFYSETDTEVIINLIEHNYNTMKSDSSEYTEIYIQKAIEKSISEIEGTYGLIIFSNHVPDTVFIVKNGSPILIAESDNCFMATSELCGFSSDIKNYIDIPNDEVVVLSCLKGIQINHKKIHEINNTIRDDYMTQSLGIYSHYTQKEIYEQHDTLMRSLSNGGRLSNGKVKLGGLECLSDSLKDIQHIVFLGCGTSYYAGCIGVEYMKKMHRLYDSNDTINYWCFDGCEFEEKDIPNGGRCLFVFISQSGETMDLIRHLAILKKTKHICMGIINVVESTIAREVFCGVYMNVGREVAVASTKSFISSLLILNLFSNWFHQERQDKTNAQELEIYTKYKFEIMKMIDNVKIINNQMNMILDSINIDALDHEHIFVIGKGTTEYIARECALKLKEICYIHGEGYSGSSLKHGPFALIHSDFPIIMMINMSNHQKMINVYKELQSRCAHILIFSTLSKKMHESIGILPLKHTNFCNIIYLPSVHECEEIIFMLALQHLCYSLSVYRNINPDKPKNLAKVVTVE
jgi:glucosamine--fructose-6-phosphate aminotransferase (isomerizing)